MRPLAAQIVFGLVLIGVWQAACDFGAVDRDLLPAPSAVIVTLGELLTNRAFLGDGGDTILRMAAAFAIGAPVALVAGFVMGESGLVGKALAPIMHLVLAVPQSIFLPVFALVFGLGFTEKLMFGITHVFFVVVVTTMAAVQEVPMSYVVAARSYGASRFRIYRSIYLPAMAPQVMTGLRLGMIFNIIGILLAEMYASRSGLGVLLLRWGEAYETQKLMATTVLISIVTIAVNELMRIWEVRVGRWRRAAESV